MKLLWLTVAPLDIPGFRVTQFGMAIALEKLGWDVYLMGKSDGTKPFEGFQNFNGKVTLIRRQGKILTELKYHYALWKTLVKEKSDIVLFEPPQLRLIILPVLLMWIGLLKARFVLDVRTPLVEDAIHSFIEQFNYTLTMRFANWFLPGITVITKALKDDLHHYFNSKKPVAIWSSGVDTEMFDPTHVIPVSRHKFGLENKFVFFNHGSLTFNKGFKELILSMKKLKTNHPDVSLVFLGDGPAKNELKKLACELRLEDTVFFLETVSNDDVPGYIAMADVGVIPLPNERCWQVSSPLKLFEYMAMQIPIIVSDIEAHRYVLGDSPYVIYVKKINSEDLYDALKLSIERIFELRKNARNARSEVIKEHTWKKKAEILSDFFVSIKNKNTKEIG